jgi:two-component sensor histidine kinase
MTILNPINFGVTSELNFYEKRSIRTLNLMLLITLIGIILGVSTVLFIGDNYPKLFQIILFIFTLVSLAFNYFKKYLLANYSWVLIVNCAVLFSVNYYGAGTGSYIFYFPLFIGLALLHNPGIGVKHLYMYYAISILFLFSAIYFEFSFIHKPDFSKEVNLMLLKYNIGFSIFATALMVALLLHLINKQNDELITLLEFEKLSQRDTINSLKEKELLVAEIHHRVKNNLAVISSLINLQLSNTVNEEAILQMTNIRNRIISISKAHNLLYKSKDFAQVSIPEYVNELVNELKNSFSSSQNIQFKIDCKPITIDVSKAIPLGLVINECVTNSIKHDFNQNYKQE